MESYHSPIKFALFLQNQISVSSLQYNVTLRNASIPNKIQVHLSKVYRFIDASPRGTNFQRQMGGMPYVS